MKINELSLSDEMNKIFARGQWIISITQQQTQLQEMSYDACITFKSRLLTRNEEKLQDSRGEVRQLLDVSVKFVLFRL